MGEVCELLINSASQGDASQLDSLLTFHKNVLDINFQTEGGLNLLMHAVISAGSNVNPKGRYLDVVKVLVRAGIFLSAVDINYGRTVSHWTVYYDKDDILTELLIVDSEELPKILDYSGLSPFHLAILSNTMKCTVAFVAHLPKDILEYPDAQGRKPLTLCILEGNLEAFILLLNAGVSLIDVDVSPLHLSAQYGQTEMLELLLKSIQVNAEETNNDGQTIAHIAATQSSPKMIQIVAHYKPELLQFPDNRGITPLMYACGYGIDTNVKSFIKKKVPLDARDNEGKTCIHWSSESQAVKAPRCIQLLCKALPFLIDLTDHQGCTPFHIAAMSGNNKNITMLANLGCNVQVTDANKYTALHWAAAYGHLECVATLIKLGIPVDVLNYQGELPVHLAAGSGNEDCLKYLLETGCDIEAKDNNQRTPVHWAVQSTESIKCLHILNMFGANFDEIDAEGLNALHIACRNDNLSACQYLIETARCSGNAVDLKGQVALFYSLEGDSFETMEYLLSRGLNCNHQDNQGRSLAHLAASVGSLQTLLLLMHYGANFELQAFNGIRPIHDAAANGQEDVLEYFASIGCNIFAETSDGGTILHYSAVQGYTSCVKMILDFNFDPNVILNTKEGDKLTPLDCAEAYGHAETAALIKNAGGWQYSSFTFEAKDKTTTITTTATTITTSSTAAGAAATAPHTTITTSTTIATTTTSSATITSTTTNPAKQVSLKSIEGKKTSIDEHFISPDVQNDQICNNQMVMPTINSTAMELELYSHAQHKYEDEVGAFALKNGLKINHDKNSPITSHLAHATTTDLQAKNNQASGTETVYDKKLQTDTMAIISATHETKNKRLVSKPSKVNSSGGLFAKAISFVKGEEKKSSMVFSSVALYGAQATTLAGAIMGSSLGQKAMEIGKKVAKNVAEDLKEEAIYLPYSLPVLLWEESMSPTPLPTPTLPSTPSFESVKPPSPVVVKTDLYEKHIRKARAQLDEKKTPAFLAIKELLKAEATHMKLIKQFKIAKLQEHLEKDRAENRLNEIKAEEKSQALLEKHNQKIRTINAISEEIHSKIGEILEKTSNQNFMLDFTLKSLGVSSSLTVSEWIKQKQEEKKANIQSNLIFWDIHKFKRDEAIKMKHLITSDRTIQHAAWDSEKNIQQKIKSMQENRIDKIENPNICYIPMHPINTGHFNQHIRRATTSYDFKKDNFCLGRMKPSAIVSEGSVVSSTASLPTPADVSTGNFPDYDASSYSVQLTPTGFKNVSPETTSTTHEVNQLWKLGSRIAKGDLSSTNVLLENVSLPVRMRATGPKSYHMGRTLRFVLPNEHKKSEKSSLCRKKSLQPSIMLQSDRTVQYHSHTRDVFTI